MSKGTIFCNRVKIPERSQLLCFLDNLVAWLLLNDHERESTAERIQGILILAHVSKNFISSVLSGAAVNEGMATDTIQNDLEVARRLLRQTQEQFDKLEFKVSKLKYNI